MYTSEVTTESELRNALGRYGTVKLTADISVTDSITISGDKTLDLNGKTITYSGSDGGFRRKSVFTFSNGSFTVKNGILKGQQQKKIRCFNVTGGTLTIEGVTIQNFSCQGGGAISIEQSGTCNMYSGSNISGNSAWDEGGGVYVRGIFNMHGGTISDNNVSSGSGGGVYVYTSGNFKMDGGTSSKNNES